MLMFGVDVREVLNDKCVSRCIINKNIIKQKLSLARCGNVGSSPGAVY